jgi:hypothetical protein
VNNHALGNKQEVALHQPRRDRLANRSQHAKAVALAIASSLRRFSCSA